MRRWLLLAVALAGCAKETGILLVVDAPDTQVGRLDYHVGTLDTSASPAPPDACGKRTQLVPMTPVALAAGRDLQSEPYRLLILPGASGANAALTVEVLGYDGNGKVVETLFTEDLAFVADEVIEVHRTLQAADPNESWADGANCFCHVGMPWLAANGDPCSRAVPCANPAAASDPVCDGVSNHDRPGRVLPCWARVGGASDGICTVSRRTCADANGVGYETACAPDANGVVPVDQTIPTACDLWDQCNTASCSDPIACLAHPAELVYQIVGDIDTNGNFFACQSPAIDGTSSKEQMVLLYGHDTPLVGDAVHLLGPNGGDDIIAQGGWKLVVDPFPSEKMKAVVPVMKNNRRLDLTFVLGPCMAQPGGNADGGTGTGKPTPDGGG
jgi:hypothetical protein